MYRDRHGNTTRAPLGYSGDQTYIQQSLLLWTPQQRSSDGTIGPGSLSFQFQFVVPFHVPSSFLFENIPDKISSAYVSYEVEGHAVTGRSYVDYQDSVKVYITNPANTSDANWTTPVSVYSETKASGVFLFYCRYCGVCCQATTFRILRRE